MWAYHTYGVGLSRWCRCRWQNTRTNFVHRVYIVRRTVAYLNRRRCIRRSLGLMDFPVWSRQHMIERVENWSRTKARWPKTVVTVCTVTRFPVWSIMLPILDLFSLQQLNEEAGACSVTGILLSDNVATLGFAKQSKRFRSSLIVLSHLPW